MVDLELMGYAEAWALQKRAIAARKAGAIDDVLLQKGVEFHTTDRGGDVTYHGPGQIVGYPILNLGAIRRDVVWYVRMLEEVMIRAAGDFGVVATGEACKTGVWVRAGNAEEKLAAIGVHISRW